jgi:hypothetical protein
MKTLYYVTAGVGWFVFYLDQGALALANDGVRFISLGAVHGPASTISISLRNVSGRSARVVTELSQNGSGV